MKNEPLFSILMANYNNAEYIKEAINSVLNQTYSNWELIIIDDASTDNSLEIIKPYLKDKRIRLFEHKKNKDCGATKRECVKKSNGELFGILDSDDVLHKDALKIMIKFHKENLDCGLIYSNYYECDGNLKIKNIAPYVGKVEKGKSNIHASKTSHFDTIKKSAYNLTNGFDPKQKKAVDRDLVYKLEEVTKLKFVNKPLYYYRMHDKGISQGKNFQIANCYYALAKYKAYKRRLKTNIPNLSKKEIISILSKAVNDCRNEKNTKLIKKLLLKLITLDPFKLKYHINYIKYSIMFI